MSVPVEDSVLYLKSSNEQGQVQETKLVMVLEEDQVKCFEKKLTPVLSSCCRVLMPRGRDRQVDKVNILRYLHSINQTSLRPVNSAV